MVRIIDGRRVSVHRSDLVELFGLISCVETGRGQVAKLLGARTEVRLTRAFGSGIAREECGREHGVEVSVREQQGWRVKHGNGESEMEINDIRMQQTFGTLSHA